MKKSDFDAAVRTMSTEFQEEIRKLRKIKSKAKAFIEYDGENDVLEYLHWGEYFDALKNAIFQK